MANKIQHKRGLKANLPTLNVAEMGFATDTKELFVGSASGNVQLAKQEDLTTQGNAKEPLLSTAATKTSPVDADAIVLTDSAASNKTKRTLWSNVKTTLKAYFDTLYNNYTHPTGDGNLHVPVTGTANSGKVLKAGSTAGSLSWGTLAKADVGLGSVDNVQQATKVEFNTHLAEDANPNLLINGNFDIWQRGTVFTNVSGVYTADRWIAINYSTIERSTDIPNVLSQYSCKITVGELGNSYFMQKSERRFPGKVLTLSFWAKGTGTISVFAGDQYLQGITTTAAWTKFIVSFTDDGVGDNLIKLRPNTTGNVYYIAQCKVEIGLATPFSPKSFGEELLLCQRYYQKSYNYGVYPPALSSEGRMQINIPGTDNWANGSISLFPKRVPPTITIYSVGNGNSGYVWALKVNENVPVTIANVGTSGFTFYVNDFPLTNDILAFHYTADAEIY